MDFHKLTSIFQLNNNQRYKNSGEITRFKIFENLTPLEADIILRNAYKRQFKEGERIVNEGDAAVGIYLIKSGEAKVVKSAGNKHVELTSLKEGSFFGEVSLVTNEKRSASVVSSKPTEVYCLFIPDFLKILKNHPAIASKFLPIFAETMKERIYNMEEEIESLKNK